MWKLALKLIWLGFGTFGIYSLAKPYLPQQGLIKGIQGSLVSVKNPEADFSATPFSLSNLKNLTPQTAIQLIPQIVKAETAKILEAATTEIKEFPAKQVKKIKIGACEELLETDICAVAKELKCQ